MAKCPHGDHDLRLAQHAELNMWNYKNHVLTVTECCGNAVNAYPVTVFRAEAYIGPKEEDDWGNPIRKPKAA